MKMMIRNFIVSSIISSILNYAVYMESHVSDKPYRDTVYASIFLIPIALSPHCSSLRTWIKATETMDSVVKAYFYEINWPRAYSVA